MHERHGPRPALNSGRNTFLVTATMTGSEFSYFSNLIQDRCGIRMPDAKKTMLESRLRKRLRHLGLKSFRDYLDYLESSEGRDSELVSMIDVVTTNKTDFFREPSHFDFLYAQCVPELTRKIRHDGTAELRVWSAGCSSGEEAYTLAMVLSDFSRFETDLALRVLGTDISTRVLEKAVRAVYPVEKSDSVPQDMRRRYLLRSRDRNAGLVRIAPEIRSLVSFRRLNFLDEDYGTDERFHVIFCRNVLIYFEKTNQRRILVQLLRHLEPDGYLFTGHSETLHSLGLPLRLAAPSVYRRE